MKIITLKNSVFKNVLKLNNPIKTIYIIIFRAKKDYNNNILLSLARPCHHCTHHLINMEKNLRKKFGENVVVKISFSINTNTFSKWIGPIGLWDWSNTNPIITFGKMSTIFSKVLSWVCIKPCYILTILSGEKKIENRPPKPKKGSWKNAPLPNKTVILGVVEGSNKKLKIGARVTALLFVTCSDKSASKIIIHKYIKVAYYPCKGFPGFISNNDIKKYLK